MIIKTDNDSDNSSKQHTYLNDTAEHTKGIASSANSSINVNNNVATASDATADTSYEDYENETLRRMEEGSAKEESQERAFVQ